MQIEIKDLCFGYYKNVPILNGINISIETGTATTILGLNGCGKTTLIKLVAGLLKSTSGTILINGKPILSMTDNERSKIISYVPQIFSSKNSFTVKEYLLLALSNQKGIFWLPSAVDEEKVKTFIANIGVDENMLQRRVDELSGGERQIIIICSALIQDAKVIILDEPTAALDIKNQYMVLQFLKKCHRENGKTILLSTHDPNHALRLGGNTIALHNGKILLHGESREIIKAENLKQIYGDNICNSKETDHNFITVKF